VALDLTPFGFTPTESLVYATLLRLGPSTGYGVARGARLARANAYGALEGLVSRGAATRTPPQQTGPVSSHRPAGAGGAAGDPAGRGLRPVRARRPRPDAPGDPMTREVAGSRAVANLVMQLVARASGV